MQTQMDIHERNNQKMIGKTVEIMVEGFDKYAECFFGRGQADAPEIDGQIFFPSTTAHEFGDMVKVKITETLDYDLIGELID